MRVGYDYNQYIGVEARGVKDFAEDDGASISHAGVFIGDLCIILPKNLICYGLVGIGQGPKNGVEGFIPLKRLITSKEGRFKATLGWVGG